MRFLLDAMLPRRLARRLTALGRDAVHTLDLPLGNRTSDRDIRALADRDGRVVVTKDADFVSSHVISGSPARLLLVSTGNTGNDELEVRLLAQLAPIEECLMAPGFVELTRRPGDPRVLAASAAFRSQRQPRSLENTSSTLHPGVLIAFEVPPLIVVDETRRRDAGAGGDTSAVPSSRGA